MHKEILSKNQVELLPLLEYFSKDYLLVGGTAIALQLGHRHSIDFDLFTSKEVNRKSIKIYLMQNYEKNELLKEEEDQIHFVINGVKVTFFKFPFAMDNLISFDDIIKIPQLINLAAMKAFALGGRGKWRDYVDLYFLIKDQFTLSEIIKKAEELFGQMFNGKLFREQISYFDDIDYSEEVVYFGDPISQEEVKSFLINVATEKF